MVFNYWQKNFYCPDYNANETVGSSDKQEKRICHAGKKKLTES